MEVLAQVVHGQGRGKPFLVPTINLDVQLPIEPGVYAVRVKHDGAVLPGVMNWGPRPSFNEKDMVAEVHLLDFSGDLYEETVSLLVLDRIRSVQKFNSIEALKDQIEKDIERAREILL